MVEAGQKQVKKGIIKTYMNAKDNINAKKHYKCKG
jgi:two-component SAPR family response regulator